MTSRLDCSVLHFSCNLRGKIPDRLVVMGEIRMMPCIALNANSPTLLRHSKDKRPAVLRVQVGICEHEEALVLLELNIRFQVVKYLTSVELFHFCVWSDTRLDNFLSFKNVKTALKTVLFFTFAFIILLDAYSAHSSEKYFENRLHIVHKHFLEVLLLLV